MKWFSERQLVLRFALVLAILIVNGLVSVEGTLRLVRIRKWVENTHASLQELAATLSTMQDAETGERGYLLTGDDSYLEPYRAALSEISAHLQRLQELANTEPDQQAPAHDLEAAVGARLDALREAIEVRRERGFDAARRIVMINRGEAQMNRIREIVRTMQSNAGRMLRRRAAEAGASTQRTVLAFAVGSLLGIALLCFVYYVIQRDLAERRQAERRTAAQHAVTRVLAEAASLAEATPKLLRAICEAGGWDLGELWHTDATHERLRCDGIWYAPGLDAAEFAALTRSTTLSAGDGFAGRVWASGQPTWVTDIAADANFARAAAAARLGLHAAFAFPIASGHATTGVLVFFSRSTRSPDPLDPEVVRMLEALGSQIGDFIARKRAEEGLRASEHRFAQFMRHMPGIAFMKDTAGRYVYANETLEQLLRRRPSDYLGKTDTEVWPADVAAPLRASDGSVLRTGKMLQTTESVPHDDGTHYWLVTKFPVFDNAGTPTMVAGVGIDITERRRAEEELRELQKLGQQRERLADIGAITAQIVHDLGNPLAGISMQAQLILRRARRDDNQPVAGFLKAVERIAAEVHRLDSLVKEFMEFSREQHLDLKAVDVSRFLQDVADLWQPVAAARQINLMVEVPPDLPALLADQEKLHRVLDNLVKNAIEAIDRGPGHVGIQAALPTASAVCISVSDTGPGIPESVQVFRLFETTKTYGSGLGLAVAQQIILAHRGTIECTRLQPHGTVFRIELPYRAPGAV